MDVPEHDVGDMKRTIKDSVFTHLFSDRRRLLSLHQALHPEDHETTVTDLTDVSIENVLCEGAYNDIGFLVRDRLVTLVESQSRWSDNVVPRALVYLGKTYDTLLARQSSRLYSASRVKLPTPELWVACPDPRAPAGPISLGQLFFGGEARDVDARMRVVRPNGGDDILQQYLRFCLIEQEEVRRRGRSPRTLEIILDRCVREGILVEYLQEHRHEVVRIMSMMYSQEEVMADYLARKGQEAWDAGMADGMAKGLADGMAKGLADGMAKGLAAGMAEGRAAGMAEGEDLLGQLVAVLLARGDTDAAARVATDADYRRRLYAEYGIA